MILSQVSLSLISLLPLTHALTSTLTQIPPNLISPNPTNVSTYIYVPKTLRAHAPILVHPHACHGKAQDAFVGDQYAALADTYGFIVLYPDSPNTVDKCWDVSSSQTLKHNSGGDSQGIVSATKWAMKQYGSDANRIFATGTSSGAMMTNVLLGAYPDIFAAGAGLAGVAFGCFAGNGYDVWSDACATGKVIKTGKEWAAIVKAAYPSYNGFRPKMQVWHGTEDAVLNPQNLQEEIKEWTTVFGYPETPVLTVQNTPQTNWTKMVYGSKFEAYRAGGVGHNIPNQEATVMKWLDLTCTGTNCYSRTNAR